MTQAMLHPIISQEQLTKVAGEACFQQGTKNLKSCSISHFQHNAQSANAIIDSYNVTITYLADRIEGACNCKQSDGFDFCQHCVCLTLHANKMAQQILSLSKGPDKSKILAFLLSQDKTDLAKQCLSLIESDPEQFERYLLRASLTKEHLNYSELKSKLTDLTRKQENLFRQRQVKHFFAKISRYAEELDLVDYEYAPDKMLKVIEHAFMRINRLLETIDDSNEQRSECINQLRKLYASLLAVIPGRPETKAKRFFSLWSIDKFELLGNKLDAMLNEDSLEKFQTLLKLTLKEQQSLKEQQDGKANSLLKWQQTKIVRFLLDEATHKKDQIEENHYRSLLSQ